MKKALALVMAVVMVFALAACGGSTASAPAATQAPAAAPAADAAPAAADAAFKLGSQGPLTGGAAIYGNAAMNGAQIAVDEINEAMGYEFFQLRYEDDAHDAEKAVNAYNALKDWGM